MDTTLKIALVGALGVVVGSLLTVVIGPHISWGIEKRRTKLNDRRERIKEWRSMVKIKDFRRESFRETTGYSTLRPYLTTSLVEEIERPGTSIQIVNTDPDRRTQLKAKVLDEIAGIEKQWKLID